MTQETNPATAPPMIERYADAIDRRLALALLAHGVEQNFAPGWRSGGIAPRQ